MTRPRRRKRIQPICAECHAADDSALIPLSPEYVCPRCGADYGSYLDRAKILKEAKMANCGECLMNDVEIVKLDADGKCPRCGADYSEHAVLLQPATDDGPIAAKKGPGFSYGNVKYPVSNGEAESASPGTEGAQTEGRVVERDSRDRPLR